jgi:glyoxylase-like metal-dependent hydrolase (beta-lactamase superfamily II)
MITQLSRRSFTATMASAAAAAALPRAALAAAPLSTTQGPAAYRYKLGAFQLTALYDGTWFLPIDGRLIRNASRAAVNSELASNFQPPDILPITITALLVNTGSKLVLIDTGSAGQLTDTAGFLNANLTSAGVTPDDIDIVLISHFHPDHINGLKTKDGGKVFANAQILVPEPEWTFWMDDGNQGRASGSVLGYFRNARRIFADIAKDVQRFKPGAEIVPGIVSLPAYGHTPGHTAFTVQSGKEQILVMSDTVRNPELFARHPDWQPIFDMDGARAVATRRRMLDRASADRMLVGAYHFPFPACGHMIKRGAGYELTPSMWRPL